MKNIIVAGIKSGHVPGKKQTKKAYTFTGAKQQTAVDALTVLGALNTLTHLLSSIGGYARQVVFDNIVPQWLHDVVAGHKELGAFTVMTPNAKAVIIPMKKYAQIDENRAAAIQELNDHLGIDIEMNEIRHFQLSQHLVNALPEDKMDEILDEIKKALLKSTLVPEKAKKEIRSGKMEVIEEKTDYEYSEDILSHLGELSKNDPKKAKAILDTVKPVFAVRSFELDNKEVEVAEALDLIKQNIDALPEEVTEPKKTPKKKARKH